MKLKLTIFALLLSCLTLSAQERDYTEWVDPFIGTADYSATHPGAVVPHGMLPARSLTASTRITAGGVHLTTFATNIVWALLTEH